MFFTKVKEGRGRLAHGHRLSEKDTQREEKRKRWTKRGQTEADSQKERERERESGNLRTIDQKFYPRRALII